MTQQKFRHPLPASMLLTRRDPQDLALQVLDGELPADLVGHYFVVGSAGDVDGGGLPRKEEHPPTVLCGDGKVTRISFGPQGPTLRSRLIVTPDLLADEIVAASGSKKPLPFENWGIARMSLDLGVRNQLNTAFEVIQDPDHGARLLATWDCGRPWELDPVTLDAVTPVGGEDRWLVAMAGMESAMVSTAGFFGKIGATLGRAVGGSPFIWPLRFTSAHPAVDRHPRPGKPAGESFFVGWSRSMESLSEGVPQRYEAKEAERQAQYEHLVETGLTKGPAAFYDELAKVREARQQEQREAHAAVDDGFFPEEVQLVRWDGRQEPVVYTLVADDGGVLGVTMSMHQLAITERYVILADTAFKFGPMSLMKESPHVGDSDESRRKSQSELTRPIGEVVRLWLVDRDTLPDDGGTVACRELRLPLPAAHFTADYASPGGRIVLHLAHNSAVDVAEWMRSWDLSMFSGLTIDARVAGMVAMAPLDGDRYARYVIDGPTATVLDCVSTYPYPYNWGAGLFAARGACEDLPNPAHIDRIWWTTIGFWPELYSALVGSLYLNITRRMVQPLAIVAMAERGGPPPAIVELDTKTCAVVDHWEQDAPIFYNSPQRAGDRYLLVMAWTPERPELWVFEQGMLAAGPVCKLGHPDWVQGFTVHSAWLSRIAPRTAPYEVDVVAELRAFQRRAPRSRGKKVLDEVIPRWEARRR